MALPFAALREGRFQLARHFQPLNWSNGRTPRRLVRHLVDHLGDRRNVLGRGMNKVIETDFFLWGTNMDFFRATFNRRFGSERKKAHT